MLLRVCRAGYWDGGYWGPGDVVSVPDDTAAVLITLGWAVPADPPPAAAGPPPAVAERPRPRPPRR